MLKYDFLWYELLFDMTKVGVIIVNSVTFFAELNDNLIYLHLAYIPLRDFFIFQIQRFFSGDDMQDPCYQI